MYKVSKNMIRNIGKDAGIDRISDEAVDMVSQEASEYILKLLAWGKTYAGHGGRQTVRKEDIKLVLKEL